MYSRSIDQRASFSDSHIARARAPRLSTDNGRSINVVATVEKDGNALCVMRMVVGERGGDKERERKCKNVPIVVGKAMGKSVKNGAGISKELWMLHVVKKFQS